MPWYMPIFLVWYRSRLDVSWGYSWRCWSLILLIRRYFLERFTVSLWGLNWTDQTDCTFNHRRNEGWSIKCHCQPFAEKWQPDGYVARRKRWKKKDIRSRRNEEFGIHTFQSRNRLVDWLNLIRESGMCCATRDLFGICNSGNPMQSSVKDQSH